MKVMSGAKDKKEEDCSCYAESRPRSACPPVRNVTHPLRYYEFTQDEIKALEECDKESFYQRCLPFSTLFATATYAAMKYGYLKPNPRFGAFPKVTLAVIVGYFLGKLSYQQACADKLMALPGSYIGQLLRDRRDGKIGGGGLGRVAGGGGGGGGMLGAAPGDIYSDAGPGSALHLDSERGSHVFSEDLTRPDPDGAVQEPEVAQQPPLSYDELRRRHRGAHADTKQDPYRVEGPVVRRAAPRPAAPPATNAYGDVLD